MTKLQGLLFVAASSFLFGMAASAQQQPPMEQALGTKLMTEIGAGLQCSVEAINTRAALDKALARIKELEAKPPESVPPQ